MIRRLAAISSGASGLHSCQARASAGAWACGQTSRNAVAGGGVTVAKTSSVTTPKRPLPAPRSAQKRSACSCSLHVIVRPSAQHDLGGQQLVAQQPVAAAQDPQPAAEREPGDADVRAAAGRDRDAVRVERVVDRAEPRARPDRRGAVVDAHGAHRRDVDHDALRRRAAGEAVAAAARRGRAGRRGAPARASPRRRPRSRSGRRPAAGRRGSGRSAAGAPRRSRASRAGPPRRRWPPGAPPSRRAVFSDRGQTCSTSRPSECAPSTGR